MRVVPRVAVVLIAAALKRTGLALDIDPYTGKRARADLHLSRQLIRS
jgi:hypothetical protein